jgi:hypothetical protein
LEQEPIFLTRKQIDAIHRSQIEAWGGLPELETYEAMIRVPRHELNRPGLAVFLREALKPAILK